MFPFAETWPWIFVFLAIVLFYSFRERPLRVYIAGKWYDRERIGKIIDLFKRIDKIEITHDWTKVEVPSTRTPELNRKFSDADIKSVRGADLLIVDLTDPTYMYRGTWTEIGVALATYTRVWIIGPRPEGPFFYDSTGVEHFANWEDAIRSLFEPMQYDHVLGEYQKLKQS